MSKYLINSTESQELTNKLNLLDSDRINEEEPEPETGV
jgi:hypothetical protein